MHAYLGASLAGHRAPGMRAKNLLGLPWRVAFALQDDGWILRNAIVWHKPNAMPESVPDRMSCRHELIFLIVEQTSYWFDLDSIRVPHASTQPAACRAPQGPQPRRCVVDPDRPYWRGKAACYRKATTALLRASQTARRGVRSQARRRACGRSTAAARSRRRYKYMFSWIRAHPGCRYIHAT
jgi:hypothetical protein